MKSLLIHESLYYDHHYDLGHLCFSIPWYLLAMPANLQETTSSVAASAEDDTANLTVRADLLDRVLRALLQDAERGEGELRRSDVNRAYVRRSLTIRECEVIEKSLGEHGIIITEDADETEELLEDQYGSSAQIFRRSGFLTDAEERECGRKIQLALQVTEGAAEGSKEFLDRILRDAEAARARFVETNVRYVWARARRARSKHLTIDDLFQEGMVGLLRATQTYDPDRGFRFKTYASWWIDQKMQRAIADQDRTIRLPVHLQERIRKIRRAESRLALAIGRPPTESELANALGVDAERLAKLLWRVNEAMCIEGDAPIGDGDETIFSGIADTDSPTAFDIVAERELQEGLKEVLSTHLSPREEWVLRMRFGLNGVGESTLQVIGDVLGVTRERIRQIEAKALRKLLRARRPLRPYFDR